ncbi:hypothetical protein G6O67_002003 [Ophiocordyceps sinensis]|uniref:Uncharacterized protein n=2 Tax=Ophiocordyceps sinensis TaxID=72228 RepID=A0A8H4PTC7_9HYPO|nr:hypothetical protein OCS_03505 [Ophiocordyceps sinensis CO18]KAF4510083.1 hypothetical protein G6O67_002003 [Ophiocordyceps sinensis]
MPTSPRYTVPWYTVSTPCTPTFMHQQTFFFCSASYNSHALSVLRIRTIPFVFADKRPQPSQQHRPEPSNNLAHPSRLLQRPAHDAMAEFRHVLVSVHRRVSAPRIVRVAGQWRLRPSLRPWTAMKQLLRLQGRLPLRHPSLKSCWLRKRACWSAFVSQPALLIPLGAVLLVHVVDDTPLVPITVPPAHQVVVVMPDTTAVQEAVL